ncbi:C2 calcium-dependent domain-containing protein 4C [Nelusetta ayraudi]|uniref:C2 calcium-dependent domain-containing protein 4C n=1 Tax=Nelusetta ayraudi TaxID=303726 RepID=UPI003F6EDE61
MWVLGKIRESVEGFPLELSRYIGRSGEETFLCPKASLSYRLPSNILTPDKIPEFCLPPRLCKRSPQLEAHMVAPSPDGLQQVQSSAPTTAATQEKKVKILMAGEAVKKPLPFSAESFGLAGMYESPNTRRKESLFLSKRPAYILDRSKTGTALGLGRECMPTSSSSLSSQSGVRSHSSNPPHRGRLRGATSCPSLIDSRGSKSGVKSGALALTRSLLSSEGALLTLSPPALFPLDVLQSAQRLQQEHVLSLQGRVQVRLLAERTVSTNTFSTLSTVRVRLVSVELLSEDAGGRGLDCAVNLCLTPGKLQQQQSASVRSSSPVFNEDFFFTELSREDLLELQLRLRVVNKPAAGTLRRVKVLGVMIKPLCQLLSVENG